MTPELVIVATDGEHAGFVYAFEQASGEIRWRHELGRPAPSDVVRHGDLVYVNTEGDSLVALDLATGSVRWSFAPPDGPRLARHESSPIVAGDHVVFAGGDGIVYALDGDSGRPAWQRDIGAAMTSPVAAGNRVYLGIVSEDRVIALSAATGALVAEAHPAGMFVPYMPPVATEDGIAMATGATLELWTADLSRRMWQVSAPSPFGRSPVVWNDALLGGTIRGHLLRYTALDGQPAPVVDLRGVVTGLVGYHDMLYVGTQGGTLYAVRATAFR